MKTSEKHIIVFFYTFIIFLILTFPVLGVEDPLTPEERVWLEKHDGQIVISNLTDFPPYTFIDENGELTGITVDYWKLIEKKTEV